MQELRLADKNLEVLEESSSSKVSQMNSCSACPDLNNHTEKDCWKLHPEKVPTCDSCGMKGHTRRTCRKDKKAAKQAFSLDYFTDDECFDSEDDYEVKYSYWWDIED